MAKPEKPSLPGGTQTRAERSDTRSLVIGGEIVLYGIVDPYCYISDPENSLRAIDVMASVAELAGQPRLSVRLNSPGGVISEGLAIYNALRAAGKPIDIHVDAMAASMGSIIAMAGDTITMAENATMMIHDPLGMVAGNAEDMRTYADELDRQRDILVNIYVARSKRSADDVKAIMAAETYFSAADAVEAGFADAVAEPMTLAACALKSDDLARLIRAPATIRAQRSNLAAPAASPSKGHDMSKETDSGKLAAEMTNADLAAIRAEAVKQERARVDGITTAVRAAKLDQSFADQLIKDGVSVDDARAKIIDKWAEAQAKDEGDGKEVEINGRVQITADAVDRWSKGAQLGLLTRAGLLRAEEKKDAQNNEFAGLTLTELARSALNVRNVRSGSLNRMEMIGRAFTLNAAGMHSSSDFGNILANTAYRSLQKGYAEADETFEQWTAKGSASDFRPISRVDLNLFPALDKVEEGAEYKYGTIGDTGVTVQIATYGTLFAITRQAIINDDLSMITRIPLRMGRGAKRTVGNLVYAVITGNPTMQDGVALFHANHKNLGTAAAPTTASLDAARAAMALQRDPDNLAAALNISPKYFLVPVALQGTANQLMASQTEPGQANAALANRVAGMATVVADARLDIASATAWYLSADPNSTDTIEVTYLDGQSEPFMDQKDGWSVDGTEFKVRLDAGVKALHWRGLFKNPGV
jgi:ATP-dependent Clp endopeptidase proteolytic subunit ClpP